MKVNLTECKEEDERKTGRKQRIYRRLLLAFFSCMLLFTILSRIVDAYEVAKVQTNFPRRSAVTKTVEGTGIVEAKAMVGVSLVEGLAAGKIEVTPGTAVKAGDPLFYYDSDSVIEKRNQVLAEIKRLELKIEAERLGAVSYEGVSRTELASQGLDLAERAFLRQQEKTGKAAIEYEENLLRLKEYYEKRLALSDEELLNQSRNDYYQSQNEYDTAQLNQESEIKSLKRKIQSTRKKLEKLYAKEEPDEDAIEELETLLDEYEDELDTVSERWDLAVSHAEEEMNDKEDIYDRARRETSAAKLALQESYEDAVKQEEKALEAALEQQQKAADDVEAAALAVSNARRDDQASALTKEQQKQLSELRCQDTKLDLLVQQELLKELDLLLAQGGMVSAPCDGVVMVSEVEQGIVLTGEKRLLVSSGGLVFKGSFDRDGDVSMKKGDEVTVKLEGEQRSISLVAEQVDLVTSQDVGTFMGNLEQTEDAPGAAGTFTSTKKSELYNTVIPLKSLRKDVTGYFCLILQPQKTILGEEYRAVRVDVELLYGGDSMAAVEGPLMEGDEVISGSDRIVNAGDRVRPVRDIGGN